MLLVCDDPRVSSRLKEVSWIILRLMGYSANSRKTYSGYVVSNIVLGYYVSLLLLPLVLHLTLLVVCSLLFSEVSLVYSGALAYAPIYY
jgi:hypothetical protein